LSPTPLPLHLITYIPYLMSAKRLRVSLQECREIHSKTSSAASAGDIKVGSLSSELFSKIESHLNATHYNVRSVSQKGVVYFFTRVRRAAPSKEDIFIQ
jgi:hypothetical protein